MDEVLLRWYQEAPRNIPVAGKRKKKPAKGAEVNPKHVLILGHKRRNGFVCAANTCQTYRSSTGSVLLDVSCWLARCAPSRKQLGGYPLQCWLVFAARDLMIEHFNLSDDSHGERHVLKAKQTVPELDRSHKRLGYQPLRWPHELGWCDALDAQCRCTAPR